MANPTTDGNPVYKEAVKIIKLLAIPATLGISTTVLRKKIENIRTSQNESGQYEYAELDGILEDLEAILHWMARRKIIGRASYKNKDDYYWGHKDLAGFARETIDDPDTPDKTEEEEEEDDRSEEVKAYDAAMEELKKSKADRFDAFGKKGKKEDEDKGEAYDRIINTKRITRLENICKELTLEIADMGKTLRELEKTRKVEFVITTNGKPETIKGTVHQAFPEVLFQIKCGYHVLLVGPSGCGKTELAICMAKHLKKRFGMISFSGGLTEAKLFGRTTPNINTGKNEFHPAPFADFYEKGGLYLLDELDAGDPNVLLSLNGAFSNDKLPLDRIKNAIVEMHDNFTCIAAANTYGNGADRHYVGRNQLDQAFLKRFVLVSMDYDKDLEFKLCPGKPDYVEHMHIMRGRIVANRLERILDTRFILRGYNWLKHGKSLEYVEGKLFEGWRPDEIQKVKR